MQVLVTGASGFAGSHIIRHLAEEGYKVRGLIEPGEEGGYIKDLPCELVQGDLLNEPSLLPAVAHCDAVIHAAGMVSLRVLARKQMAAVNIKGTENMLIAAKAAGVKRFVHLSSIGVLGGLEEPGLLDEDHPSPNADHQGNFYHYTKIEGERLVLAANRQGFETIALLPGLLYGANDWRMSSTGYIYHALKGIPVLYPPRGGTSMINILDMAVGTRLALEKGRAGERYIITGENITTGEMHNRIVEAVGPKAKAKVIPLWLISCFGWGAEALGKMGVDIDFSMDVRRLSGLYWYCSGKKAEQELGYKPLYSARETINEAVDWYKTVYSKKKL